LSFLDTKKVPLVLLHRHIVALPDVARYDLMLTPQFYVIKREALPLKYAFQAKKLAPSILEDLTGEGTFSYEAFQEGDTWVFIAYDLPALATFLETKNSSIDRVRHLYFAEQGREKFTSPVTLDEREALTQVNNTVTVVPKSLLQNTASFSPFDETFRPPKHYDIKRSYNSFLDTRLAMALAIPLALLGLTYIAEGYRYHAAVATAEQQLNTLLEANPSLQGAYARKAILKKYTAVNALQRRIRDRIKDVGHLTGNDIKINALSVDTKGYRVTLTVPKKPKTVATLKKLAASGGLEHLKIAEGKLETWGSFQ